ncbi:membrane protein insertase YidC [Methylolobus aquaticus]|nr:membrane protein insertase YidC [Methylolobus aquaticus]
MANIRFVLFIILAFMCYSLWQQWQLDYGPKPPQPVASDTPGAAGTAGAPADTPAAAQTLDQVAGGDRVKPESLSASANRVVVTTDTLRAAIDPAGGDLRLLELLQYPISKNEPDRPFRLLTDESDVFIAQAGLLGDPQDAPTHHSVWTPLSTAYTLEAGQDSLRVPLTWTNGRGLTVTKTYTFQRGSYSVQLEHRVDNRSAQGWTGKQYVQLQRTDTSDKDKSQFVRSYLGGVLYTPEARYEKISFSDMTDKNLSRSAKGGWVAMIQHYFLAAWIPSAEQDNSFYTKDLGNKRFLIGATGPDATVAPGQTQALAATLYAGPKLQRVLEATAPGLELTVDFGALTVIAKPIFWLLEWFHKLFNNWGFAIISVTLVIKALFFKLSEASYRSMANMRKLQPKLQELKERCGDDRQRFNQAMMEMYRKERVNPLGGCLPILVQIPVFIALYWVLAESVELRQAPFLGWLNDLSARDPYYVLPLIMVISMVIQQKLNPAPADPVQAKVMQFFPYLFGGFFAFFPSGLVLYWVVNNILSIAQQWYITKQIEKPAKSPA